MAGVIMNEEGRGELILLEHRNDSGHVRIVTLPSGDLREWWVMRNDESVFGFLMGQQIVLEPACLGHPKGIPFPLRSCDSLDIAVDDGKVAVAPVKRVVRSLRLKEILEVVRIAFVVPERGKERRLAKQILLYSENIGHCALSFPSATRSPV